MYYTFKRASTRVFVLEQLTSVRFTGLAYSENDRINHESKLEDLPTSAEFDLLVVIQTIF